jgi:parvulin-like peptidyl-prolyl isomerase
MPRIFQHPRINIWFVSVLFFFFLLKPAYALQDAIVAVVNDKIITLQELKDYIRTSYVELVAEGVDREELKAVMASLEKDGIEKLIEDRLILTRAKEVGLEVREQAVDERLENIKKKYPSEEVFVNALVTHGATITDLRNKIRDQLEISFIVEHEVKSKIFVNPQEVTDYYEDHLEDYKEKEKVDLQSIYFSYKNNKETARNNAEKAFNEIKGGKDFVQAAKEYSELPSIGVVERGQLNADIEAKVFSTPEGAVTPVIETPTGVYIFKVIKRFPSTTASLASVKNSIYNRLYKKKFEEKFTVWLNKLKKNAYIEIKQ